MFSHNILSCIRDVVRFNMVRGRGRGSVDMLSDDWRVMIMLRV